jgi:hypothetical protein
MIATPAGGENPMTTQTKTFKLDSREYMIGMLCAVGIHYHTQVWQVLWGIEWWHLIFSTIAFFAILYLLWANYITVITVPVDPNRANAMMEQLKIMGKPITWCLYATNIFAGLYLYYNGLVLAPLIIALTVLIAMINWGTLKPYLKLIMTNMPE